MTILNRIYMVILHIESNIEKTYGGELFFSILYTTLLQIFCEFMLHSKVILKSKTSPDDSYQVDLQVLKG